MQIGGASAGLLKSKARILRAESESVAEKQILRLWLCKSERLFGNHEQTLLGAQPPQWRGQHTSSQDHHMYISWHQRKQAMEERGLPIGVIDQMQIVNHQNQRLRLALQIIDIGFCQRGDIEFA
jgi:hypothetical protein